MDGAYVYVAYAPDDAGEVSEIAEIIRGQGWSVCFGHLTEPGSDDPGLSLQRIAAAACVVIVWSSNAVWSSLVRSDALEAARQNKLLMIVLDDVVLPVPRNSAMLVMDWREASATNGVETLIARIQDRAGAGRGKRGGSVPYRASGRTIPWWLGALAGASVAAAAFVFGSLVSSLLVTDPGPSAVATADPAATPAPGDVAGGSTSQLDIPRLDASALRGLLGEPAGEPVTGKALSTVQRLEQFAWEGIFQHDDLLSQIDAIGSFRLDFPDGAHFREAADLDRQRRGVLTSVQANLVLLGFLPRAAAHEDGTTREAMKAFQRSIGASPTGRVTEDTLAKLVAAAGEASGLPSSPR